MILFIIHVTFVTHKTEYMKYGTMIKLESVQLEFVAQKVQILMLQQSFRMGIGNFR